MAKAKKRRKLPKLKGKVLSISKGRCKGIKKTMKVCKARNGTVTFGKKLKKIKRGSCKRIKSTQVCYHKDGRISLKMIRKKGKGGAITAQSYAKTSAKARKGKKSSRCIGTPTMVRQKGGAACVCPVKTTTGKVSTIWQSKTLCAQGVGISTRAKVIQRAGG